MSLTRRHMLGLAAAGFVLAGCAAPLITAEQAQSLSIREIVVDTSGMERAVSGRNSPVTTQQLQSDLQAALDARLKGRAGERPGVLRVNVQAVNLIAPGVSLLVPAQSSLKAVVSVTDAATGEVVLAPTEISSLSEQFRLGGIIGAATAPSVEKDYRATLSGFARNVEKRLYGESEKS